MTRSEVQGGGRQVAAVLPGLATGMGVDTDGSGGPSLSELETKESRIENQKSAAMSRVRDNGQDNSLRQDYKSIELN